MDWPGYARTLAIIAGFVVGGLAAAFVMGCAQGPGDCRNTCAPRDVKAYVGVLAVLGSACVCADATPEPTP